MTASEGARTDRITQPGLPAFFGIRPDTSVSKYDPFQVRLYMAVGNNL